MAVDTASRKHIFLRALRDCFVVRTACEAAGINRTTAYRWREKDPEFRRAWESATEDAVDLVEETVFRRAVDGNDRAASMILKATRAAYKDHTQIVGTVEVSGAKEILANKLDALLSQATANLPIDVDVLPSQPAVLQPQSVSEATTSD